LNNTKQKNQNQERTIIFKGQKRRKKRKKAKKQNGKSKAQLLRDIFAVELFG
jgi:hypothetical protein